MRKKLAYFLLFFVTGGCLEPYEFVIEDNEPTLVVESYISDKSFNETLMYPSDGRYFTVKLTLTGDVTNNRPAPVTNAVVNLMSDANEVWSYTESDAGTYKLLNDTFKAEKGKAYKVHILLPDENVYESGWESLPDAEVAPMGEIGFTEIEKQTYVNESREWVLRSVKGINAHVQVPQNTSGKTIHYRWTYDPTWIFVAPLVSTNSPVYKCWATDPYYFDSFGLQIDNSGGYAKDLFFIPTTRNIRIFEKFSVLVTQHAINEPYFSFWKEMKDRNEGSTLADVPPYNLKTNFSSPTGGKKVSGYFGVSAEQAKRWYFNKDDLSFYIENTWRADCLVVYGPGPPAPECLDCREYSFGKATTEKPLWWAD